MRKVAFAITAFEGVPFDVYLNHILCLCHWKEKYEMMLASTSGSTLVSAREGCLELARKGGAEYILYVDSDVILPLNTLDSLISCDVELASGLCTKRGYPFNDIAWIKINDQIRETRFDPDVKGVYPVEWVGGGCALFKVSAFDKLERPYFRHMFGDFGLGMPVQIYEDIYLCMQMQKQNMNIVVDTRVQCGHKARGRTVYPKTAALFKSQQEELNGMKI